MKFAKNVLLSKVITGILSVLSLALVPASAFASQYECSFSTHGSTGDWFEVLSSKIALDSPGNTASVAGYQVAMVTNGNLRISNFQSTQGTTTIAEGGPDHVVLLVEAIGIANKLECNLLEN